MSHRVLGLRAGTPEMMRNLVESGVRSAPNWLKQCAALESAVKIPMPIELDTEPGFPKELNAQEPIVLRGDRSRQLFVQRFGPTSNSANLIGPPRLHLMNTFAYIVSQREAHVAQHHAVASADDDEQPGDLWEPVDAESSEEFDLAKPMPAADVVKIAQADIADLRKLCVEKEILPVLRNDNEEYAVATMRFSLIAEATIEDFAIEHNLSTGNTGTTMSTEGPLDAFFAIIGASKDVSTDPSETDDAEVDVDSDSDSTESASDVSDAAYRSLEDVGNTSSS